LTVYLGPVCTAPGCDGVPALPCEMPLTGSRQGELCDKFVCDQHAQTAGGIRLCGPHARRVEAEGITGRRRA
jgi:hypothetical protein